MPNRPEKLRKRLPRDMANSFDLPESTGAVMRMVSGHNFLEVYTVSGTYRMQTPDNLDPDRKIPNMPWALKKVADVGASNLIVARVYLQAHDIMRQLVDPVPLRCGDPKRLFRYIHTCKEELLACEAAHQAIEHEHVRVVEEIKSGKVQQKGNVIECPQIPELERLATNFIAAAKRAAQATGEVFNEFFRPVKPVKNGNFLYAIKHLEAHTHPNQDYLKWLLKASPVVKTIVDLRNAQEHPTEERRTLIENIHVTPDGFVGPTWRLTPGAPRSILPEMNRTLRFLVQFAELSFLFGFMENVNLPMPVRTVEIPAEMRDPNCPIKYAVEFALFPPEQSPHLRPRTRDM